MTLLGATGTPTGGRRTEKHFTCLALGVTGMGLVSSATQGEQGLQGGLAPCLSPPGLLFAGMLRGPGVLGAVIPVTRSWVQGSVTSL